MKFDVVMPTLNSVSRVGKKTFRRILYEIYAQIPVSRVLVIDDNSNDETIEVLKEFNTVIINGQGSLGKAREMGIHRVQTEWFYFIDDDNLVPPYFHEKMWKHVNGKAGMVFPHAVIPYNNYFVRYENIIGKIRRSLGLRDVVEGRGYTGATLLRKQAVDGIQIPAVSRQEDFYIKKYCEKQNWIVKYASDIIVLHLHRDLPNYLTQYLEGYGMAMVRSISEKRMLTTWLLTYLKSLFTFPYVRNLDLLREVPKMYYIKYKGYMDARDVLTKMDEETSQC